MAKAAGFEPAAAGLEILCSIQLSYASTPVYGDQIASLPRKTLSLNSFLIKSNA
jgi:hypothetical protein